MSSIKVVCPHCAKVNKIPKKIVIKRQIVEVVNSRCWSINL